MEKEIWKKDRYEAFETVINLVLETIQLALNGEFREIDSVKYLNRMFKWKIAFLYSDKRLIPIFSEMALRWCAMELNMNSYTNARISSIQEYFINTKPKEFDCFQFTENLYASFEIWKARDKLNDINQGTAEAITSELEGKAK